ncbi:MAG: hypothetical protein GEV13_13510 [Rhodospirillales bacterium]|nr:hypothetical protein [Rhodospirillales bacterium]
MPISHQRGFEALKVGVIDAAVNNLPLYFTSCHFEVAKYFSPTEHSMAPGALVFSKQVWGTLSKEDQAIIQATAKESVPYMRKLCDEAEISTRKVVVATGAETVVDVDKASFANA